MSVFGTRVTNPSQHLQTFQTIPYKLMWLHILQIKNPHFFFPKNFPIQKKKFTTCSTKCLTKTNKIYFAFFPYLFFGIQLMQPFYKLRPEATTAMSIDEHDDRSLGRLDIEVGPLVKPSLVGRRVLEANSVVHGETKVLWHY